MESILKMMLLGRSQSGKTMYMAVFFRERRDQRPKDWSLAFTSAKDADQFAPINRSIDVGDNFAPPTRGVKEWGFDANTESLRDNVGAFSFSYVDYEGEFFDNHAPNSDPPQTFYDHINTSDILYAVLDGEDVLEFLEEGDTGKDGKFSTKYFRIMEILRNYQGIKHIIISKWDVILNKRTDKGAIKYFWEDVRSKLLKWALMSEFIRSNPNTGVRLIPISALEGKVENIGYKQNKKIVDGALQPINTNIPLALAFEQAILLTKKELRKQSIERLRNRAKFVQQAFFKAVSTAIKGNVNLYHVILTGFMKIVGSAITLLVLAALSIPLWLKTNFFPILIGGGILALIGIGLLVNASMLHSKKVRLGENIKTQNDALRFMTASLAAEVKAFDDAYHHNMLT